MPGGLLLFSPWCDPTGTHHELAPGQGLDNANRCDYINPWLNSRYSVGAYALRAFLADIPLEVARKNPYITPSSLTMDPSAVNGLFTGFPPTYIVSGDAEALIDEIRTLQRRMSADMPDGQLRYDEVVDAIHDFVACPIWEPERGDTFQRVTEWIWEL
jgi:acetyl esterase/lipase